MEAECGKPCYKPPLCFVTAKTLDKEDMEDDYNQSITAELNQKTTMKTLPHTFANVEAFSVYQNQHA